MTNWHQAQQAEPETLLPKIILKQYCSNPNYQLNRSGFKSSMVKT